MCSNARSVIKLHPSKSECERFEQGLVIDLIPASVTLRHSVRSTLMREEQTLEKNSSSWSVTLIQFLKLKCLKATLLILLFSNHMRKRVQSRLFRSKLSLFQTSSSDWNRQRRLTHLRCTANQRRIRQMIEVGKVRNRSVHPPLTTVDIWKYCTDGICKRS